METQRLHYWVKSLGLWAETATSLEFLDAIGVTLLSRCGVSVYMLSLYAHYFFTFRVSFTFFWGTYNRTFSTPLTVLYKVTPSLHCLQHSLLCYFAFLYSSSHLAYYTSNYIYLLLVSFHLSPFRAETSFTAVSPVPRYKR